jgi:hypothetical protein
MKVFTLCFAVAGVVFFVGGMIASASDRNNRYDSNTDSNEDDEEGDEDEEENGVLINTEGAFAR